MESIFVLLFIISSDVFAVISFLSPYSVNMSYSFIYDSSFDLPLLLQSAMYYLCCFALVWLCSYHIPYLHFTTSSVCIRGCFVFSQRLASSLRHSLTSLISYLLSSPPCALRVHTWMCTSHAPERTRLVSICFSRIRACFGVVGVSVFGPRAHFFFLQSKAFSSEDVLRQ